MLEAISIGLAIIAAVVIFIVWYIKEWVKEENP